MWRLLHITYQSLKIERQFEWTHVVSQWKDGKTGAKIEKRDFRKPKRRVDIREDISYSWNCSNSLCARANISSVSLLKGDMDMKFAFPIDSTKCDISPNRFLFEQKCTREEKITSISDVHVSLCPMFSRKGACMDFSSQLWNWSRRIHNQIMSVARQKIVNGRSLYQKYADIQLTMKFWENMKRRGWCHQ